MRRPKTAARSVRTSFVVRALVCCPLLAGCLEDRTTPPVPPVFDTDVAPILEVHCASCHGATSPAAGWAVTSFLSTIGCVEPSGAPAALPPSTAPILTALGTASHQGLLDDDDQATLEAWVTAGAPAFVGTVHPPGIVDPRSSAFHGAQLRSERWSAMLDPADPNACGQCHAGTPARPPLRRMRPRARAATRTPGVRSPAARATAPVRRAIRRAISASFRTTPPRRERTRLTSSHRWRARRGSPALRATPFPAPTSPRR
jgi:hypothetical protein